MRTSQKRKEILAERVGWLALGYASASYSAPLPLDAIHS